MKRALPIAVLACLALPGVASAEIVPQKSIAGVRLGMTQAKVKEIKGEPSSTKRGSNDFGPFTQYRYPKLTITFKTGECGDLEVVNIRTTSAGEETSSGVGVGSTEAAVKKGVRRVKCETIAGFRSCHVGSFTPGRTVTDFAIKRGKVTFVNLGIVID